MTSLNKIGSSTISRLKKIKPSINSFEEAVSRYKKVVQKAVDSSTSGIEECSLLLSGGVDSAFLATELSKRGIKINAYTSGPRGSNDIKNAAVIAKKLGIKHHRIMLDKKKVESTIEKIVSMKISGGQQIVAAVVEYSALEAAKNDVVFTAGSRTTHGPDALFGGVFEFHYPWIKPAFEKNFEKAFWDLTFLILETSKRKQFTLDRIDIMANSLQKKVVLPFEDFAFVKFSRSMPARFNFEPKSGLFKMVHRQAAFEAGVPKRIAFERKLPPQTAEGLEGILDSIASERVLELCPDWGSNYLIGGKSLVAPVTHYYLRTLGLLEKNKFRHEKRKA